MFVCMPVCVFDFVWRTLQIASEKATPKHSEHVSLEDFFFRLFFFAPLPVWFRAARYKLPLWERAFPANGLRWPDRRALGDEGEPWAWFQSVPGLAFVHSEW